ncbi:type I CRISPR-associated protein Cas8a1/Csx8 [Konateibacter massiliensis]|uniref:type I CRISPR-associated protein Cas8a1/Csx8 n=1 Tax=Konateibacter massiliensis TaxID=2002841 RepID=UPI001F46D631|nr:type I CRISPR-associated protein Cas8a1/Csx8 [Konateibacter massiliensis]
MNGKKGKFNSKLEAADWRTSAALLGLVRYLKDQRKEYYYHENTDEIEEAEDDVLYYNKEDITEEGFLKFVEYYFSEDMHHMEILKRLKREEFSEEEIKAINEKLTANTVLKKVYGKIKFDGKNVELIKQLLEENRAIIIKETFRNKSNLYKNFCNPNQLLNEAQTICRLNGYYIDSGKKGKSIGYQFDMNSFVGQDNALYDFVPAGFTIGREALFINDNSTIEDLIGTNERLKKYVKEAYVDDKTGNKDVRRAFFKALIEAADFIDYDVEVILKDREKDFFETLYVRKSSIRIFRKIKNYSIFCISIKVTDDYYINVNEKVTDSILNMLLLDDFIDWLLKNNLNEEGRYRYLVDNLLTVNILIRQEIMQNNKLEGGNGQMNKGMNSAYASAKEIVAKLPDNKVSSYRNKLTSALVFKDYNRFCEILLQLGNYADMQFDFAYGLFEDFEGNRDIACAFINSLYKNEERTKLRDVEKGGI